MYNDACNDDIKEVMAFLVRDTKEVEPVVAGLANLKFDWEDDSGLFCSLVESTRGVR